MSIHSGKSNFEKRKEWATKEEILDSMRQCESEFNSDFCQEPDFEALWEQKCHDDVVARDFGQPAWAF